MTLAKSGGSFAAGAVSGKGGREVREENQGWENSECDVLRAARGSRKAGFPFLIVLMGSTGTRDTEDRGGAAATQQSKA